MKEQILKFYKQQEFEELEKLVEKCETEELLTSLNQMDKEVLAQIFPKLPEEISAECFIKFDIETQKFLMENVSEMNFKDISEEILETDGVEEIIETEIFNEVILQAEADTRHEKLLEIIDGLNNNMSLEDIKELIKKNSRNYAKRQFTYFNHQLNVNWFGSINEAEEFILKTLGKE